MSPSLRLRNQFYRSGQAICMGEESSHWREFKKQFRTELSDGHSPGRILGYGFGESDRRPSWLGHCLREVEIATKLLLLSQRGLFWELLKARRTVRKMGLFFSTDAFRHVCTMCLLKTKLTSPPGTVALIGDGPGIMSAFLRETWPSARLILIDLGATLAVQAQNLEKAYPKDFHVLAGGGGADAHFTYVPAENLGNLPAGEIDLAINVASMQEMKSVSVQKYFTILREKKTKVFYCCNRLEKIMPDGEVSRFMDYPWLTKDSHLVDEPCPWHNWFLGVSGKPAFRLGRFAVPLVRHYDGPHWHRLTELSCSMQK